VLRKGTKGEWNDEQKRTGSRGTIPKAIQGAPTNDTLSEASTLRGPGEEGGRGPLGRQVSSITDPGKCHRGKCRCGLKTPVDSVSIMRGEVASPRRKDSLAHQVLVEAPVYHGTLK